MRRSCHDDVVSSDAPARPVTIAVGALVAATAVWGSTFLVTKQSLGGIPAASFVFWRFGIAAGLFLLVRPQQIRAMTPTGARRGCALGLFLASGFLLQTVGLHDTDAGVSGFLTGTAVVLTPLIAAAVFHEHVGSLGWAAVAVATCGLALLVLRSTTVTTGALLTIAGAACFALHIASLSRWADAGDAVGLTAVSVITAAAVSAIVAFASGGLALPADWPTWRSLFYLAVVATCIGFAVQAWAQSVLSATSAAVVMTMEPFFAAVLAMTVGGETLGIAGWVGGALIVTSMFVAELGPRDCCDAMAPRVECC